MLKRSVRFLFNASFATTFILFSASCEFLGSKYEYGKAPAVDTSVNNLSSDSAAAGRAAYLGIIGNNRQVANECSAAFTVTAQDLSGQSSLPFDSGAMIQITDSRGAQVFTDVGCTQSAPAGQVPAIADTNTARFYIKGALPGTSVITASYSNLPNAQMGMNWVAGPVKKLEWTVGSTLSAFECVPLTLKATDINGNLATLTSAMDARVEITDNASVKLYDRADCLTTVRDVQIPAGAQPLNLWILSSVAGMATLSSSTTEAGVTGSSSVANFVVQDSPRLVLSGVSGNVPAGTCVVVTARTEYQGSAYQVRVPTDVTATKLPTSALIYANDNCANTPAGASAMRTIPALGTSTRFSMKSTSAGDVDVAASASGYVSNTLTFHIVAAAPSKIVWTEQPALSTIGACTTRLRFRLKDPNDITAIAGSTINVGITAGGTAASGAQYFLQPDCSGPAITSVDLAPGSSDGEFYAVAIRSGALETMISSAGLLPPSAAVTQISQPGGQPNRLATVFTSPVEAGQCTPIRVLSQDAFGNARSVQPNDLIVGLQSLSPTVRFYDSRDCDSPTDHVVISAGATEGVFYFWNSAVEIASVTAKDMASPLQVVFDVRSVPGAPAAVELVGAPPTAIRGLCSASPFSLRLLDRVNNPTNTRTNVVVQLTSTKANETQFFSDANCNTSRTSVTIPANSGTVGNLYVKLTAAPGAVNLLGIGPVGISAGSSTVIVSNPPTHLALNATPNPANAGDCVTVDLVSLGVSNTPEIYDPISVLIGSTSIQGSNVLFSNSSCTTLLNGMTVTLSPSLNPFRFYVKSNIPSSFSVSGTSQTTNDIVSVTLNVTPGPLNKVRLVSSGPGRIPRGVWSGPYQVDLLDRLDNVISADTDKNIVLVSPSADAAIAASNAGAGTPKVAMGASSGNFYLRGSAAGTISLSVSVSGINSNSVPVVVLAPTPVVTSLSPTHGPMSGDTIVTITGSSFESGATVSFGGSSCAVDSVAATSIVCRTSGHAIGVVDVVITNTSSDPGTLANAFTYDPLQPTITDATPRSGPTSGGTALVVSGSNFTSSTTVSVGGSACARQSYSSSSFTCLTSAHAAGVVDVVVSNGAGGSATLAGWFTYLVVPPTVSSISPSGGPLAGGTSLSINGTGIQSGATVTIGGNACVRTNAQNNTVLFVCSTPAGTAGAKAVVLRNPDGGSVTYNSFTYAPGPSITSRTPSFGPTIGNTVVTFNGTFNANAAVTFDGQPCAISSQTVSRIYCLTPAHAAGEVTIRIINPDGQVGTALYNYVDAPTVTSLSPNYGPTAGGTLVTITGGSFINGMSVTLGGVACVIQPSPALTANSFVCRTGARAAGTVSLAISPIPSTVTTTVANAFIYGGVAPSITSVSPAEGPKTGGTRITIRGANFVSGATIKLGGTPCLDVVFTNSTYLQCTTPAHVAGVVALVVTNPNGISGTASYNYINSAEISCYQVFSLSNVCGQAVTRREFGVAFVPRRPGLNVYNNMPWVGTITPYLYDQTAAFTGAFNGDLCNRKAQFGAKGTPYPTQIAIADFVVPLYTNGCLGSSSCPAFYTVFYSPLILDLQGQGIALSAPNAGVRFNIDGTGDLMPISWPTNPTNSVFLALDKNNNGKIESIFELFGNNTIGPDGKMAADGFAALAKYDANRDRMISAADPIYSQLKVWKDLNKNGTTESGELVSLQSAGVRDIDLNFINVNERNDFYGNETLARSVVHLSNGQTQRILDIWFVPGPTP